MTFIGTAGAPAPLAEPAADAPLIEALDAAIEEHDHKLAGTALWIGAEPTFTDRFSEAPEWLHEALGNDKEARAQRLMRRLAEQHTGAAVLRSIGRPYPHEPEPRWCYGLYASRDGTHVWTGPADRLRDDAATGPVPDVVTRYHGQLRDALRGAGWFAEHVAVEAGPLRLWCRSDGVTPGEDATRDAQLLRSSVHGVHIEGAGPVDGLASTGDYL
jgi:hypothetical protein